MIHQIKQHELPEKLWGLIDAASQTLLQAMAKTWCSINRVAPTVLSYPNYLAKMKGGEYSKD
jgi:hypothetical protein